MIRRANELARGQEHSAGIWRTTVAALPKNERDAADRSPDHRDRAEIAKDERKLAHFDDSPDVLELVCSKRLDELARAGTSCPDHFLRTKIRRWWSLSTRRRAMSIGYRRSHRSIDAYRADYAAYYERCKRPTARPMRDPNPIIFLVPGVGLLSFARDKTTARLASEFYVNAIHVMRGATSVSQYVGLDEQEAFDIEYWRLEEAKLRRDPKPKPLTGRVAYVTGGAGGIGKATARRLVSEGACVVMADIDAEALEQARGEIAADFGPDSVRAATCNVTNEGSVARSFERAVLELGGVDIVVSNAGIGFIGQHRRHVTRDVEQELRGALHRLLPGEPRGCSPAQSATLGWKHRVRGQQERAWPPPLRPPPIAPPKHRRFIWRDVSRWSLRARACA